MIINQLIYCVSLNESTAEYYHSHNSTTCALRIHTLRQ
jgi:hypothetical protein